MRVQSKTIDTIYFNITLFLWPFYILTVVCKVCDLHIKLPWLHLVHANSVYLSKSDGFTRWQQVTHRPFSIDINKFSGTLVFVTV